MAKHVCCKVDHLRRLGYFSIREWLEEENTMYVGRDWRVWITEREVDEENKKLKTRFSLEKSKWYNPFKLKTYTLEESLKLYEEHLYQSGLIKDLKELEGKDLGCFCDQNADCHAKLLARKVNELCEKDCEEDEHKPEEWDLKIVLEELSSMVYDLEEDDLEEFVEALGIEMDEVEELELRIWDLSMDEVESAAEINSIVSDVLDQLIQY